MAEITNPTTPNATNNGAEDVNPNLAVEMLTKKVLITRIRAINPNIKGLSRELKKDLLKIYEELTGNPILRYQRLVYENRYLKKTNAILEGNLLWAHRGETRLQIERNQIKNKNLKAKEKLMDIVMLIMDLSADESINEGAVNHGP
jgi:hypothetical protein